MNLIVDYRARTNRRPLVQILFAAVAALFCLAQPARAQKCDPVPADIVSWWSGESNALDNLGINNGTYEGTPAYAPGEVGTAFSFNGSSQYVVVPDSPSLHITNEITLEAWVYPTAYNPASSAILCKYAAPNNTDPSSWSFFVNGDARGGISMYVGGSSVNLYSTSLCPTNAWTHLAVTYDGSWLNVYFNGALQNTTAVSGAITVSPYNLGIGANVGGGVAGQFSGLIDEPAIFSRALSADEIQAIYDAGSAGMCAIPISVVAEPTNETCIITDEATFSVVAIGAQPLSFQWYFNGTNLPGATNTSLILTNVQYNQAGTYYVAVSNASTDSPVLSSNATLTVLQPPACDPVPSDIVSWWSGESNALDNLGINNGTFVGTPSYAPGKVGSAFSFNGSSQYVVVSNSPSLQISNELTLEAWVYPTAYNSSSDSTIMCKYASYDNPGPSSWSFFVNGSGYGGILANSPGGTVIALSTDLCPLNTWTHLAATYDGSNLNIYFNGVLQNSSPMSGGITLSAYNMGIGANVGGGVAALFIGLIDEAAIFNRALSADEINAIYAADLTGMCPIPAAIVSQPTNETVPSGTNVVFTVGTVGSQPMSYQWYFNGTNINGANGTLLILSNLTESQSGSYYLSISNAAGGPVISSNAVLTVLPPPPCDPAPSNIVSWWSGESNAYDNVGGNTGTLVGSPSFTPGKVGLAFNFNGSSQFVRVPDEPNLHCSNAMTLEAWVYPTAYNGQSSAILCKYDAPDSPGGQASWSFFVNGDGRGGVLATTNAGGSSTVVYSTNVCPLNTWTHLAATYDSSTLKIYFNGALQNSSPMSGNLFPGTDDVGIGANIGGVPNTEPAGLFAGLIDEPTIYNRALSSNEIAAIYNAGVSGKCPVSLPPQVYYQPASQKVPPGSTVTFNAAASGSPVLDYLWKLDGSALSGATNRTLVLSNVTTANAGTFSMLVSNSLNSSLSSNALLEIVLVTVLGNGKPLTNSQYTFTNSITISMTNFFTNGYIFYTLNGTTPTPDSPLYTNPFVLTTNAVIQTLGYSADFSQTAVSDPINITLPTSYTLTTSTAGGGSIALNPSGSNFLANTVVTLTAIPSNGWTFLQWMGDAAGANASTSIVMDRNKSVQAVFGTSVGTSVGGNGSIVLNPAGGFYPFGAVLQVIAVPQPGNFLVFWGDAASGDINPLSFHVTNASPTISALFYTLSAGDVSLAVVPVGHGTVSINPPANTYSTGSTVTITATPNSGHAFLGWSGSAAGTNNPLNFMLNESATIYANFSTNNSLLIYPVTPPGTADGMAIDLNGELGVQYRLDASTNFTNWTTLYNLTNAVGTIHYIDANAATLSNRFYRGVILP